MEKVYFDELYYLTRWIKKRKLQDYRMQLAIVQNPHVEKPDELWKQLQDDDPQLQDDTFDKEGLQQLKNMLSKSGGFKVK